jgi:hypothetical protein
VEKKETREMKETRGNGRKNKRVFFKVLVLWKQKHKIVYSNNIRQNILLPKEVFGKHAPMLKC